MNAIRIWLLRWKLRALRRERARYYRERAGYDWAIQVNSDDMQAVTAALVCAQESQRRRRFDQQYGVRNG